MPYYWVQTDFTTYVGYLPTLAKIAREAWVIDTERWTHVGGPSSNGGPEPRRRVYLVPHLAADVLFMIAKWIEDYDMPTAVFFNYWAAPRGPAWIDQWDYLDRFYIAPAIELSRAEGPEPACNEEP